MAKTGKEGGGTGATRPGADHYHIDRIQGLHTAVDHFTSLLCGLYIVVGTGPSAIDPAGPRMTSRLVDIRRSFTRSFDCCSFESGRWMPVHDCSVRRARHSP